MGNRISVFITTSIDGYIADKTGGIGWLDVVLNPDNEDHSYGEFMSLIDAE